MTNSQEKILFSIIIPIKCLVGYIEENCQALKKINADNFEVIILPDEARNNNGEDERRLGAKIISTGKISPAGKRDLGARQAKGKYLAFIDDDAYPEKDWLKVAEKYLKNDSVAAVGGPQLTPAKDTFWQKVSGAMFISPLSGAAVIRYLPGGKVKEVDDWPTVNFIIKKADFEKLGGFNADHWPGEDTKLCLDIINKLKKKILYIPNLKVYHHRRAGLIKHLRQTGGYGLHRGYFARVFPLTSRKFSRLYFMPSFLVLFLFLGIAGSFFSEVIFRIFLLGLVVYLNAIFISALIVWVRVKNILISLASLPYLILFHFWYGIRFIQGFIFTKNLKSRLEK